MSLLAYSPLGGGILTGKYLAGLPPPDSRFRAVRRHWAAVPEAHRARGGRGLRDASREQAGRSLVELALGYVRSRWHLGAMIIGATTMAQLEENIAAAEVELDASTLAAIAALQMRFPNPAG